MTKSKTKPRMVHRRVYRGWIDPTTELPNEVGQRTEIIFGNTKWYPKGVRCKITVECYDQGPHR